MRWSVVAGALVFDAGVAARILAPALRTARDEARRNGVEFDGDLLSLLAWIERVERAHQTLQVPPPPPPVPADAPDGSVPPASEAVTSLDSRAVAQLAGVSERAVRKAAATGRLAGRQVDGIWEFTSAAADRWIRNRGV